MLFNKFEQNPTTTKKMSTEKAASKTNLNREINYIQSEFFLREQKQKTTLHLGLSYFYLQ